MSLSLPNPWNFDVDLGPVDLDVDLSANLAPLTLNLGPIEFRPLEVRPLDLSLRLKEIPSIRAHLPVDYRVGLSVLGFDLLCVRLCGQGQVITEPYVPNPCETRADTQGQPSLAVLERIANEQGKQQ